MFRYIFSKIGLFTVGALLYCLNGVAQSNFATAKQIDSVLANRLADGAHLDTLNSSGGTYKNHKKIWGVKVRVDKGRFHNIILRFNKQLLFYNTSYISNSKRRFKNHDINFYFLDTQVVKYEGIFLWKKSDSVTVKRKAIFYLNNNKIVDNKLDIIYKDQLTDDRLRVWLKYITTEARRLRTEVVIENKSIVY